MRTGPEQLAEKQMHVGERSPHARAPACTIREACTACTEGNKRQTSARRGCCFGPDLQQLLRASPPELEGEGEQRWEELLLLLLLRPRPYSTAPPLPPHRAATIVFWRQKNTLPPSNISPDELCNTFNLFRLFLNRNLFLLFIFFFALLLYTSVSL